MVNQKKASKKRLGIRLRGLGCRIQEEAGSGDKSDASSAGSAGGDGSNFSPARPKKKDQIEGRREVVVVVVSSR